jgi:hypothetical protein
VLSLIYTHWSSPGNTIKTYNLALKITQIFNMIKVFYSHFKSLQVDKLSVAVSYRGLRTQNSSSLTAFSNLLWTYSSQLSLYSGSTDHRGNTILLLMMQTAQKTCHVIPRQSTGALTRLASSYKHLSYCCNALNWRLFTSHSLETLWSSTLHYIKFQLPINFAATRRPEISILMSSSTCN